MKMKIFVSVIILLLAPFMLRAQTQEATTTNGKKVILFADGTWKYAEEKNEHVKTETTKIKEPENKKVVTTTDLPANCSELFDISEDPKTGARITKTRNLLIISKDGDSKEIAVLMQKGFKSVITLTLKPVGAGECIAEGSKINLVFMDGSKMDLVNDGFTNCRGEVITNFGGQFGRKKQLAELSTKKIRTIRVWTQAGSVMEELSPSAQDELLKTISCLAN
jgi:hypothetical protein